MNLYIREQPPPVLVDLISRLSYKPGWSFRVEDGYAGVSYFVIQCRVPDSEPPHKIVSVQHRLSMPPAYGKMADDAKWWRYWLIHEIIKVETHEACEFFSIDGEQPFFPEHNLDAYAVREKEKPWHRAGEIVVVNTEGGIAIR